MFEKILVPVDGSDCSMRAADVALTFADRYDASVHALLVLPPGSFPEGSGPQEDRTEAAREILDAVAALGDDAATTVETHLREGRPSAVVSTFAAEQGFDLLVMGRHGRAGLGEHLLGTVTERVLRRCETPVLTVADCDHDATYRDVLVTTDGSENAEQAAPYADDIARRFDATLHILTAVDVQARAGVFSAGGVSQEFVDWLEEQGREATDRLVGRVDDATLDVRSAVVQGVAHRAIGEYVADHDVDLVVMASEGESSLAGQHLGSVAARVLRTVDVPVLVVTS